MSNIEADPQEVICENLVGRPPEVIKSREVPLGGPRQMLVKRTLPARGLSLIGAWCFADHYGPTPVSESGGMRVPGHPHTGLQTVSWLFEGEIEHRDTAGFHAFVRPGEVNIMTAGSGIAHSEYSTANTSVLHGMQLWVALPEGDRFVKAHFEHDAPEPFPFGGGQAKILVGEFASHTSPVHSYTDLVGVEITFGQETSVTLPLNPEYEYGLVVDRGGARFTDPFRPEMDDLVAEASDLMYFGVGRTEVAIEIQPETRVMLLGGRPFGEKIVMWWNFIGRSHDEIEQFREAWQTERDNVSQEDAQYGIFPTEWDKTLPAPELPNVRLRPRE